MATYIKTLKEDNGDITYPQTKAEGVLLNNGSDLETELSQYVTAEEIGSTSDVTPVITTAMIADGAVTTEKIANGAVTSSKIDLSTLIVQTTMPDVSGTTISKAWTPTNIGSSVTVSGLDPNATYLVLASTIYTEGNGEFRLRAAGANTVESHAYNGTGLLMALSYQLQGVKPNSSGKIVFQRTFSGNTGSVRCADYSITILRVS